jgi:hypothetical protein
MNVKPRFSLPLLAGLGLALAIAFGGNAWATDYYVATTGSDSNAGTQAAPWSTIAKCASTMSAGDTCYIRGGTYHEHGLNPARSGTAGSPITFAGYPGESAIIDGDCVAAGCTGLAPVFFTTRAYMTVQDLEIRNAYFQGWYNNNNVAVSGLKAIRLHEATIRWDNCTDCLIDSSVLHDVWNDTACSGSCSGYGNGVMTYQNIRWEIKNTEVYNAKNLIFQKEPSHRTDNGMRVHDNRLHDGSVAIRYGLAGSGSHPHYDQESWNNVVYNVTTYIYCECDYATGMGDGLTVYNNTVIAHDFVTSKGGFKNQNIHDNLICLTGSSPWYLDEIDGFYGTENTISAMDYNLYDSACGTGSWKLAQTTGSASSTTSFSTWKANTSAAPNLDFSNPDAHGLFADPKFMDASAHDYRICDDSPAVGAGSTGGNIGAPTAVVDCPPAPVTGVIVRPQ